MNAPPKNSTDSCDPVQLAIPDNVDGQWWVAHTKSRNEKALARDLQRLEIVHYLPLQDRVTRSPRTGRPSHSTIPLFTGYLFFAANQKQRLQVLDTNRVARTLHVADQATLVSQLRQVHRVLLSDAAFEQFLGIKVGRWVRVIAGPLTGVEGTVVGKPGRTRLAVSVDILGQSVLVEVDATLLEPADPPSNFSTTNAGSI